MKMARLIQFFDRHSRGVMGGLILTAVALAYHNSLRVPFLFDDGPAILRNQTIRQLWALPGALQPPLEGAGVTGRPLVNLSLAINYAWGGLAVPGYHMLNLLLHGLTSLTLWGVLRRTLCRPVVPAYYRVHAESLAGGVALWWSVHPLLTESVVCVVQRNEIMGGLFYLLTLYGFIRSATSAEPAGGGERGTAIFWAGVAVASCLSGMASKEIMATAPFMVLLYDRTFVAGSFSSALKQRSRFYLSLAATWALLAWLMLGNNQRDGIVGFGLGVSGWEYLLTQCRALVIYLRLSLWPHPLVLDYGPDMVHGWREVWWQGMIVVSLLLGTLVALWRRPVLGFVGAWFFVILAPSSSFIPLTTQPMAEHRMYLPLVAVLMLLMVIGLRLLRRGRILVVLLVAITLGVTTDQRNQIYGDEERLWRDLLVKQPVNARAYASLAHYLVGQQRWAEAAECYEQGLRLRPDYADAQSDYASVLLRLDRRAEAIIHYQEARRLKPADAAIQFNLGLALAQSGRSTEARDLFAAILAHDSGRMSATLYYQLGNALFDLDQVAESAVAYRQALERDPNYPEAHHNLALVLVRLGRPAEAIPHYEAALRQLTNSAQAHHNFAIALERVGRVLEAIAQDEAALRLAPDFTAAREHRERLQRP
jgi:tetratricopeptide (TPR) repeat protein